MPKRKQDDPLGDIRERLAKVETRLDTIQEIFTKRFEAIEKRIETLDSRLWWLLGGIGISILLALLQFAR